MHILVGTDGSPAAVAAAQRALELFPSVETVTLLSAVEDPPEAIQGLESGFAGGIVSAEVVQAGFDRAQEDARVALEATTAALKIVARVPIIRERAEMGDPGPLLCSVAAELGSRRHCRRVSGARRIQTSPARVCELLRGPPRWAPGARHSRRHGSDHAALRGPGASRGALLVGPSAVSNWKRRHWCVLGATRSRKPAWSCRLIEPVPPMETCTQQLLSRRFLISSGNERPRSSSQRDATQWVRRAQKSPQFASGCALPPLPSFFPPQPVRPRGSRSLEGGFRRRAFSVPLHIWRSRSDASRRALA